MAALEFTWGSESVRFLVVAKQGTGIIVADEFSTIASSVFKSDNVLSASKEELMRAYANLHTQVNLTRPDSIQIWLETVGVVDSQKVFRVMMEEDCIVLPFRSLTEEESERLHLARSYMDLYNPQQFTFEKPRSIRQNMSVVREQGDRGTCSVFAAVALFEFNRPVDLSEQCLAFYSGKNDSEFVPVRVRYGLKHGLYYEHDCPYDPSSNGRDKIPSDLKPAHRLTPPEQYDIRDFSALDAIDYVRHRIDLGYPIAVTFYFAGAQWFDWKDKSVILKPDEKEIVNYCKSKSSNSSKEKCGTHAVAITGYDDSTQSLEFKNSWTGAFKDSGYGRLSYEYYLKMGCDTMISGGKQPKNDQPHVEL